VKLTPVSFPGYQFDYLKLNDKRAQPAEVRLPAGQSSVVLHYASQYFHFTQKQLNGFAFLADKRINFACVAAEPGRRDYARVIKRLSGYFEYYAKEALGSTDPGAMEVLTAAPATAAKPLVVLDLGTKNTGWKMSANDQRLTLHAANEAEAVRRIDELLDALDLRYPHIVPFRGGMMGMNQPIQEKHKMMGKTLQQLLSEEGIQ
jgi:hypothetical protein